jgi:type IV pilus assembly protein PilW
MGARRIGCRPRHHGASLIEVMVGVTLALLTVLVIYHALSASESLRRDIQGAGEAQQTGLLVLARLALDIANAGAGFASNASVLGSCPNTADIATTLRPIVALITDGGSDDVPDSLVVRYGVATGAGAAVPFAAAAPPGSSFTIAGTDGFAPGDRVIASSRRGDCAATGITSVHASGPGLLELAHEPIAIDLPDNASLLNLGPGNRAQTLRFDVAGGVLRTTDLAGGDAPNPLASNVVNLKFQYGIDVDGNGILDTWLPARDAGLLGSFTPTAVLAASVDRLRRIKAIRVGVIVRSDFQNRSIRDAFRWVLFDCAEQDKSTCPGRLSGSIPAPAAGSWRYRVYETVVPLRNQIWNRS